MTSSHPILIMTRPIGQAKDFVQALREIDGAFCVEYEPLIDIEFLPVSLPEPQENVFAFTSAKGVDAYLRAHRPVGNVAYCVNDATATRARAAGFHVRQGKAGAASMADDITTGPVIYVHGEQLSFDLAGYLHNRGMICEPYLAYRQVALKFGTTVQEILQTERCILPVFSTHAGRVLHQELQQLDCQDVTLICISEHIAHLFDDLCNCVVKIAEKPNRAGMITAVLGGFTAGK